MPAPLLTIFGRAVIALIPRLVVYVIALFAGAGATVATEQVLEVRKKAQKAHVEKMRREAQERAFRDLR